MIVFQHERPESVPADLGQELDKARLVAQRCRVLTRQLPQDGGDDGSTGKLVPV